MLSAIGEPLRAEIELSVSAEELETVTPRFAPAEAYAPAGLQYNTALNGARLAIHYRSNGRRVIDIVTLRPVSEPSIPLLIELEVRGGRIVRTYNVLLGVRDDAPAVAVPFAADAAPKAAVPVAARAVTPRPSAPRAAVAKTAAAPAAIADNTAFDRELQRLESQLSASAKTFADMLGRVTLMERQVAQLRQDFAAQRAAAAAPKPVSDKAEAKPVADKPAAEKLIVESPAAPGQAPAAVANVPVAAVTPAPVAIVPVASAPVIQEVQGQNTTRIDAVPRQSHKSNYMLNEALLILAGGALCLLAWLAYWMWGRRTLKTAEESPATATEN